MADPTPALSPNPAAAPAASAPAPADWTAGFNDAQKGLVAERKWENPAALLDSYHNLEKLRGVPADRLLTIPGDDKPESWAPIYDRLGRPKEAKEYGLPVPEGGDAKFAETAAGWFHEAGLNRKQAAALAEKWNGYAAEAAKQQDAARSARNVEEHTALAREWGAAFEQNIGAAKLAAKNLGFDAKIVDALESALGYSGVMKLMHSLGTKMGEATFVGGDRPQGFNGVMTPEQARLAIQSKRQDTDFVRRLTSGDAAAKAEWDRLHKWSYPDQA